MTLSLRDIVSVGANTFNVPAASIYINKDTLPITNGSVFYYNGAYTGDFDLYVPQNMVAQYQASTDWNASNIYAYDFENNTVL
jgi:hypothetical protein